MDISKIDTTDLVQSFQKLGDAHRFLKAFTKLNRNNLSDQSLNKLNDMIAELQTQQQSVINFAFDSFFKEKGKPKS